MKRLLPLLFLAMPLHGQVSVGGGTVSMTNVTVNVAAAAGCNEFTDDFTGASLTNWTQDTSNNFSLDTTNDELDYDGTGGGYNWIYWNADTTTDADQCCLIQVDNISADIEDYGCLFRFPTVDYSDHYSAVFGIASGEYVLFVASRAPSGSAWDSTVGTTSGASAPDDGDYISFCIEGTGNDTVLSIWDHGASDPGDCRSGWGTADYTIIDDPINPVNSGTLTGIWAEEDGGNNGTVSFSYFAGSDY